MLPRTPSTSAPPAHMPLPSRLHPWHTSVRTASTDGSLMLPPPLPAQQLHHRLSLHGPSVSPSRPHMAHVRQHRRPSWAIALGISGAPSTAAPLASTAAPPGHVGARGGRPALRASLSLRVWKCATLSMLDTMICARDPADVSATHRNAQKRTETHRNTGAHRRIPPAASRTCAGLRAHTAASSTAPRHTHRQSVAVRSSSSPRGTQSNFSPPPPLHRKGAG